MSEMVERVARAICDAENGIDGDSIGTMIHEDFRIEIQDGDKGLGMMMDVCRRAARAALAELREPTAAMLQGACGTHKVGEPMPGTVRAGTPRECPHFKNRRRIWGEMVDEALR